MTTIGVISDTHGHLDPRVFELFAGVDHILHAGDIGSPGGVLQLEKIAPVTAVAGNCDLGDGFRERQAAFPSAAQRRHPALRRPGDFGGWRAPARDDQGRGRARGVVILRPGTGEGNGAR
jgi:hypothetical protein